MKRLLLVLSAGLFVAACNPSMEGGGRYQLTVEKNDGALATEITEPAATAEPTKAIEPGMIAAGTLSIDKKLEKSLSLPAVIFVMVKPEAGPPVAVRRIEVNHFPAAFEISAEDLMMGDGALNGSITVVARVDQDGVAGPASSGDLEGVTAKPVKVGDSSVLIMIDKAY